jgi:deoxyribodipyrimidine photo-lyase
MSIHQSIHWFRQDLRCTDNPALFAAVKAGSVLPLFHLEETLASTDQIGGAGKVWLHQTLTALNKSLDDNLCITTGSIESRLPKLVEQYQIKSIYWNHCPEPWRMKQDEQLKQLLEAQGISVHIFNGSYLWSAPEINKDDGTPYRVFTPFYRKGCLNATAPRKPLPDVSNANWISADTESCTIDDLCLIPTQDWHKPLMQDWNPGEKGALQQLNQFTENGIHHYKDGRNFPSQPYVSRLSPHLHWGELSPNQAWHAVEEKAAAKDIDHFRSELGWREFSAYLLHHNPDLQQSNLQSKFNRFPWNENSEHLKAWQKGQTGIPIVDAGMRELYQTGYMHNRVRMIVGSFLVKNLRLHWKHGEAWFRDCLLDADHANNSASWQWIAGCGADAAPYFRIFNPISQGNKFDADGAYTRRFVPELAHLPDTALFNPWETPALVLQEAGVVLGETYPHPIVDLKQSREEALAAFSSLKEQPN